MAAEVVDIVPFTYTGEEGEVIPRDATHVSVDVTTIPARAFYRHPNIVAVICHNKVEKIEEYAFFNCPSLRRLTMPGVKIAERSAFIDCEALTDVECDKLEIIGQRAFKHCRSLRGINLPSARIAESYAFYFCEALTSVKIGNKLDRIEQGTFIACTSLERITIPLKDGIIVADNVFTGCESLNHVDLVEGAELRETIAALHFEEWRNDMRGKITSINQILPNADAGGEKALIIRRWLRSVLGKMIRYKAEHQGILDEAASTLVLALPRDIVMNNILPFLALPPHRFGVEM